MILAGFDSQTTGRATPDFLLSDLRAFVKEVGLDTLAVAPDSLFLTALADFRERISSVASGTDPSRTTLWMQLLESLATEAPRPEANLHRRDTMVTREERNAAFQCMFNIRDAQMAKNLLHPPQGGEWLREPMISRPAANSGMKAVWPRVLDGMFYRRDWRPATRISR